MKRRASASLLVTLGWILEIKIRRTAHTGNPQVGGLNFFFRLLDAICCENRIRRQIHASPQSTKFDRFESVIARETQNLLPFPGRAGKGGKRHRNAARWLAVEHVWHRQRHHGSGRHLFEKFTAVGHSYNSPLFICRTA